MASKKKLHLNAMTNYTHSTTELPSNQTRRYKNYSTAERWYMPHGMRVTGYIQM